MVDVEDVVHLTAVHLILHKQKVFIGLFFLVNGAQVLLDEQRHELCDMGASLIAVGLQGKTKDDLKEVVALDLDV